MNEINFTEKEIKESIDKFKSLKIVPYSKGQNVLEYLKYFDNQYASCFKNGLLHIMTQKHQLSNSYFRFRKNSEIKDYNNVQEFSYPKPIDCKDLKRANLPGYPVFYCSHHPVTAILEMEKWNNNESKYVVSKWTKTNDQYKFIQIPTFPDKPQFFDILKQTVYQWADGNADYKNALIKFIGFIGDQLIQDNNYSISASIAYKYIYEQKIEVISYPSCIDLTGINFAISPDVINKENLVLDRVYIVELGKQKQVTVYHVGIFNNNGTVSWHKADELPKDSNILTILLNDFSAKL